MDVRYEIEFTNKFQKDADMRDKMHAIDITAVEQERAEQFVVHTNSTTIPSSGTIRRTIQATLTADFLVQYPDDTTRRHALKNAFSGLFNQMLPAQTKESITLI
jgi:hypothetical protein